MFSLMCTYSVAISMIQIHVSVKHGKKGSSLLPYVHFLFMLS